MEEKILLVVKSPMSYLEIEKEIGKVEGYLLAITLSKMVMSRKLYYASPSSFASKIPMYSKKPFPKKYECPKRITD